MKIIKPQTGRRQFNKALAAAMLSPLFTTACSTAFSADASTQQAAQSKQAAASFNLAVMTWSFQYKLWTGELKAAEIPALVASMDVDSIEWASKTFRDLRGGREVMYQAAKPAFFQELRKASDDAAVRNRVMSAGGHFYIAGVTEQTRNQAVEYFLQWVEPAQILGCDILRAELYCDAPKGPDREAEAKRLAMDGLNTLLDRTADSGLIINIENHHGISSQAEWMADLVVSMNNPRLGLCADTNNFRLDQDMPYERNFDALPRYADRYQGLELLLPLANWVSAKTYAFDGTGYEVSINYPRIIELLRKENYTGYLSIEYEGGGDTIEGVKKSVEMFRRLQEHFA